MKHRIQALVVAVTAALLFATVAVAQAPTGRTYGGVGPSIDEEVAGGAVGGAVASGALPFTGFDAALALSVGVLLIVLGFATRKFAAARD